MRLQSNLEKSTGKIPEVTDHGSWDGRWGMPRRSTWQKKEQLGTLWPKGSEDLEANFVITEHEVNVILASRKEYKWHEMDEHQKKLFAEAADTGWKVWVDNDAVSVLSKQEAAEVRESLSDLERVRRFCNRVLSSQTKMMV